MVHFRKECMIHCLTVKYYLFSSLHHIILTPTTKMEMSVIIEFMDDDEFRDQFIGQGPLVVEEQEPEPVPKKSNEEGSGCRMCCVIN